MLGRCTAYLTSACSVGQDRPSYLRWRPVSEGFLTVRCIGGGSTQLRMRPGGQPRYVVTQGPGSRGAGMALAFKLLKPAQLGGEAVVTLRSQLGPGRSQIRALAPHPREDDWDRGADRLSEAPESRCGPPHRPWGNVSAARDALQRSRKRRPPVGRR
jgi:hypothetical protein